MADTPGPGAALLDRPAAVAHGDDLDALAGCFAPGDRQQAPAHPGQGAAGAGQARRSWAQIVTVVPGLAATARCPACGADAVPGWPPPAPGRCSTPPPGTPTAAGSAGSTPIWQPPTGW